MTDHLDARRRRPTAGARLLARVAALLALGLFLGSVGVVGTGPVHAADNGSWAVTPVPPKGGSAAPRNYFVLEGDAGATIKDSVRIQNWTKSPLTFRLYGADGYNTTQDGFFALRGEDQEMVDVGSWVSPLTSQVTVYGRTQVDVPVTIKIPRNATPGDHVGGVVAMNVAVESQAGDGSLDVGVKRAVGARMYVRVSGPTTPALSVTGVALEHDRGLLPWTGSGTGSVTYTVENTGNVRLSPRAVVRLSGLLGERASFDRPEIVDLLPGQSTQLTQPVDSVPALGRLTTTVSLDTEDGVRDQASTTTWLVPWPGVLLVAVLLAGLATLVQRRRNALARRLDEAAEAPRLVTTTGGR